MQGTRERVREEIKKVGRGQIRWRLGNRYWDFLSFLTDSNIQRVSRSSENHCIRLYISSLILNGKKGVEYVVMEGELPQGGEHTM